MFVRMAWVALVPELASEARRIHAEQAAPRVRAIDGSVGCFLLEPVNVGEPHIACTLWRDETAARAYESSGAAQEIAGLIRHAFAGPPRLESFRAPD